jgi:hypothetical protein
MAVIYFRGYRLETRTRAHDSVARVTDPDGVPHLFVGKSQMEAERMGRDYIKARNPWRDEDEEGPEVA